MITLTNIDSGSDTSKSAIWIDTNIDATEIAGTTAALAIASHLLSNYGKEPGVTRLLYTCSFYNVPRVNTDGAELAMAPNPRFILSGMRPYPWIEKAEGLHTEYVDQDGRILQMHIIDPNGDWKISTLDPRLIEERAPDDYGEVY